MSDSTPIQPSEPSAGDADAGNGGAPAEGTVAPTKPRRKSPTKSRQTKAKRAGGEEGWVTVSPSDLLERVGELTEQLTRARVGLETLAVERNALSADLERERARYGDAERRALTSQSAMVETERQLALERRSTEQLETALEAARRQNEETKRLLLNLGWSRPLTSGSDPPVSHGDWRHWLRRR